MISILDFLKQELSPDYIGKAEIIDFSDYGIPQHRKRLITVYTRDEELLKHFEKFDLFYQIPLIIDLGITVKKNGLLFMILFIIFQA